MPPLTEAEKAWLKKYWGGSEFWFLRSYCLSIYEDEELEEGRAIMKAMIEADAEEQAQ